MRNPFEITHGDSEIVCKVGEEMTVYQAKSALSQIHTLMLSKKNIRFNLESTLLIDTSGIQLLLATQRALEKQSLTLTINPISDESRDVFVLFNCFDHAMLSEPGEN